MISIPKDKIKTGVYQYISTLNNRYLILIFKEYNKIISFYYTRVPFYKLDWQRLIAVEPNSFHGTFYKTNTIVKPEKRNEYYIPTDEA